MIEVKLTDIGTDEIKSALNDLASRQIPFAISKALNQTGKDIREFIKGEIPRIFDNPVDFTLNSIGFWPGTKERPEVVVGFKEWASKGVPAVKYLQANTYGGQRKAKKYEVALRRKGIIGAGQLTVPDTAFRDSKGNVQRGEIIKMLSSLQAFTEVGYRANAAKGTFKAREFFAFKRDGQHTTIYKRVGKSRGKNKKREIVPFLHVIDDANYNIIFDFDKLAMQEFNRVYLRNFQDAIVYAIETAK